MKKWLAVFLTLLLLGALALSAFVNIPFEEKHYHTYKVVNEATCFEEGLSECECGETKSIIKVQHKYEVVEAPTCNKVGIKCCSVCGDEVEISKTSHEWEADTCLSDYVCVNCNEHKNMDVYGPHVDSNNDGICDVCGNLFGLHVHVYDVVYREPTCVKDGEYGCACGQNYIYVPALGHDLVDGACSRCDFVQISEVTFTVKIEVGPDGWDQDGGTVIKGTTWTEFCAENDYWVIENGYVFHTMMCLYVADENQNLVLPDSEIVAGEYYGVTSIPKNEQTFTIRGSSHVDGSEVTYTDTVANGTTWREWCESKNAEVSEYGVSIWDLSDSYVYEYLNYFYVVDSNGNPVLYDSVIVAGEYGGVDNLP